MSEGYRGGGGGVLGGSTELWVLARTHYPAFRSPR